MLRGLIKGDNIELEVTVNDDITNWKIRCEIYDEFSCSIQLATTNSGGDNNQIEITDAVNGIFIIKVGKNITTDFNTKSFIEIEREDDDAKVLTIYQDTIKFKEEKITWTIPTD